MKYFTRIAVLMLAALPLLASAALTVTPEPPKLKAGGYILMDFHSGQVLVEKDVDTRMEPASLTKLMTAYAVFKELKQGNIQLSDPVLVSEKAWRMGGSKMFIEVGKEVKLEDLLRGMIIQSGNDASVALAEYVAGTEGAFASLMNQYAQQLAMTNTQFKNATGWPAEGHYTTPRDLAVLARAMIHEFPEYYAWYSEKEFKYNGIKQSNRNLLLWRDETVDGLKTGHTEAAGYCLVSSAKRDGMRLISVVMGTSSQKARAQESQALLNFGFRFYETHQLYKANESLKDMKIWKGATDHIQLGVQHPLYITVSRGQFANLKAALNVEKTIMAPASKGQQYGSVKVSLNDQLLAEAPLIALHDVAEGGFVDSMMDSLLLMFE